MSSVHADAVVDLSGGQLLSVLRVLLDRAHSRIWLLQFVIDVRPSEDSSGVVRYLLHRLAAAAHRGLDVRVLVPVLNAPSGPPHDVNAAAGRFLATRGVRVRRYSGSSGRPHLHAKALVVDDDLVIVGNANWTPNAFLRNAERSVAIRSADANAEIAARFARLWRSRSVPSPWEADPMNSWQPSVRRSNAKRLARAYWPRGRRWMEPLLTPDTPAPYARLMGPISSSVSLSPLAGQPYVRAVASLISKSKRRVFVAMHGLRATADRRLRVLVDALKGAADRGVDARVLYQVRDGPHTDWTMDVPWLRSADVPTRPFPTRQRMHARAILVDDTDLIVGSVGWTPQSVFVTEELSIHVKTQDTASSFGNQFERWWSGEHDKQVLLCTHLHAAACGCGDCPSVAGG